MRKYPLAVLLLISLLLQCSLRAALWEDPIQEENGWKEISWFGWIMEQNNSWIIHEHHGDLFVSGVNEESLWFYDLQLGWVWTGSSVYPVYYHAESLAWFSYERSTSEPRLFYHYSTDDWAAVNRFAASPVIQSKENWDWNYQTHTATDDLELLSTSRNTSVRTFELTVIENDWIRVKLLPDWGGRILSIFYKPLGFEMLYYPRAGARSRIIEAPGTFYYDWILLAYGINPTFPSGEHGKYWGVPWPLELLEASDEKITFRMSQVDDDYRYNANDVTNLRANMDISVYRDRYYLEVEYTLINQKNETVNYEFWTPAAFSPTLPTESSMPLDTEIIMNHDEVSVYDWWNWMDSKETYLGPDQYGITPHGVYTFDALRDLANWDDVGIAYAYPELEIPYFGALNHADGFGAMRTADDPNAAPGMKIWGGGIDSFMWELWSGVTPQFFLTEQLPANGTRNWKEFYLPFAQLESVSHATKFGVAEIDIIELENNYQCTLKISGTMPGENWVVQLYPMNGAIVSSEPIKDWILSFDNMGTLIEQTKLIDSSEVPPETNGWYIVITELFTGEERMEFIVGL